MFDIAPLTQIPPNEKQELYKPCNGPLGSYINAPLILPSFNIDHSDAPTESLPLGGFCLMSPKAREPGSFTQADQDLLANLGQLAAREILRGFGERERARHEAQAAFLSEVIGLDIVDAEELIGAKLKSPGMAAVRDSSVPSATARVGLAAKRSVQRLCSLTSADAAIMLDVHAAFGSSRLYYSVVGALRPITVLASEGFDLPAGGMFHGQQEIREMLAASKAWKPVSLVFLTWDLGTGLTSSGSSSLLLASLSTAPLSSACYPSRRAPRWRFPSTTTPGRSPS